MKTTLLRVGSAAGAIMVWICTGVCNGVVLDDGLDSAVALPQAEDYASRNERPDSGIVAAFADTLSTKHGLKKNDSLKAMKLYRRVPTGIGVGISYFKFIPLVDLYYRYSKHLSVEINDISFSDIQLISEAKREVLQFSPSLGLCVPIRPGEIDATWDIFFEPGSQAGILIQLHEGGGVSSEYSLLPYFGLKAKIGVGSNLIDFSVSVGDKIYYCLVGNCLYYKGPFYERTYNPKGSWLINADVYFSLCFHLGVWR